MPTLLERIEGMAVAKDGCWIWKGALQSCGATPVLNIGGQPVGVLRAWLMSQGVDMKGYVATNTCANGLCVRPEHAIRMTRKALQQRTAKSTPMVARMARAAKNRAINRTPEKTARAERIRQAVGTQAQIAAREGVSQSTVWAIKTGKKFAQIKTVWVGL